jgi:pRiA4b ORF-3-like protein
VTSGQLSGNGRGPRRAERVTYRVRVDLKETKPLTWRRLDLASDLNLAEVHDILQAAFGWTDSHLHGFAAGPEFYSAEAERYLCPFDVMEGEDEGTPEEQVRLDEVLAEVGDTLAYAYDYGDGWQHLLTLEAVHPRDEGVPKAVCTEGERGAPAEDCGGVYTYELISAAIDPANPNHAFAVIEFAETFGDQVDPRDYSPTPFDIDQVNATLGLLGANPAIDVMGLPAPLAEIVRSVRSTDGLRTVRQLIAAVDQAGPIRVDVAIAKRMVRQYVWLLDRVGSAGIRLTSAGYLPPAHVAAAFAELGLKDEWPGRGNREADTWPVLHLRESAQKMGLVRKHRGELRETANGRALRGDPIALWLHLARRMPLRSADPFEFQAGLLLLLAIAGEQADDLDATIAHILGSIGWALPDGSPPTPMDAHMAARDTYEVLRRVGAIAGKRHVLPSAEAPTAEGVIFARAALHVWPG